jgi:hypothetical protein
MIKTVGVRTEKVIYDFYQELSKLYARLSMYWLDAVKGKNHNKEELDKFISLEKELAETHKQYTEFLRISYPRKESINENKS